jgi:hypothetical protein
MPVSMTAEYSRVGNIIRVMDRRGFIAGLAAVLGGVVLIREDEELSISPITGSNVLVIETAESYLVERVESYAAVEIADGGELKFERAAILDLSEP